MSISFPRLGGSDGEEQGIGLKASADIYSGDCVPLTYKGVPSVTLERRGSPDRIPSVVGTADA